ncbi:MAG: thiamine phosphate synthase [Rhodospirillaceae bacterium]|nr:thiamine phosphate synthase [Rhodospirillaceae bacterium]
MLTRLTTLVTGRKHRGRARRRKLAWLWLMSDDDRLPDPADAIATLPAGSGVILRHANASTRRALAEKAKRVCAAKRMDLLIASDWRLAAAMRCAGVHVPETVLRRGCDPGLRLWRRQRRAIMTASAHSTGAVRAAHRAGADLIFLSPVFATVSHPGRRTLGRLQLARIVRETRAALAALGGITARTVGQLNGCGVVAVGGIGLAVKEKA